MITVSTSSIRDWHRCSRYYQHKHVDRVVPVVESKHLRIGTLVHKGLEAWFTAAWWGQRNGRLRAALNAVEHEHDVFGLARVRAMLLGYTAVWGSFPSRVVAVERTFHTGVRKCDFCDGTGNIYPDDGPEKWECVGCDGTGFDLWFTGRVDALVEWQGETYAVEHKTTSSDISAGSIYWDQRRMDPQVSNYIAATGACGLIYDVLRKPSHRPKDGETPDEFEMRMLAAIIEAHETYYVRRVMVRLEQEADAAKKDLVDSACQIAHARRLNVYPRNPDACIAYGQRCEYLDVCMGTTTLDNSLRYTKR